MNRRIQKNWRYLEIGIAQMRPFFKGLTGVPVARFNKNGAPNERYGRCLSRGAPKTFVSEMV